MFPPGFEVVVQCSVNKSISECKLRTQSKKLISKDEFLAAKDILKVYM